MIPQITDSWRNALKHMNHSWKPYIQSLYVDLKEDDNAQPTPIHLGFSSGINYVKAHLNLLRSYGVNHVIFNLKYGKRPVEWVIEKLGNTLVPEFHK